MNGFFKTVTSGVARHVFAWLLPSALSVGVALVILQPSAAESSWLNEIVQRSSSGVLPGFVVLIFATVALAVLSGYASAVVYRFFEGYYLPRGIRRVLLRKQLRRWWILHGLPSARPRGVPAGRRTEAKWTIPERAEDVLPTRLGNSLRAAETYGRNRWNLDTMTVWHELVAVTPPTMTADADDARSAMDFFVGMIVNLALTAIVSLSLIPGAADSAPLVVLVLTLSLVWPSYLGAVHRVQEYRSVLQAIANLGREPLARSFGFGLPDSLKRERFFWANLTLYVRDGDGWRGERIDRFRQRPQEPETAGAP